MDAKEFITNTFNTDFLLATELETLITAMELYAAGKLLERNIQCACEEKHKHGGNLNHVLQSLWPSSRKILGQKT